MLCMHREVESNTIEQKSQLASFRSVALFANFRVKTVLNEQVKRGPNLDAHGSSLPEKNKRTD